MSEDVPRTSPLTVSVGIVAGIVAFLSLLMLMSFVNHDEIVILGGHLVGGTSDRFAAGVLATLSGAVAVFTLLRTRRRLR